MLSKAIVWEFPISRLSQRFLVAKESGDCMQANYSGPDSSPVINTEQASSHSVSMTAGINPGRDSKTPRTRGNHQISINSPNNLGVSGNKTLFSKSMGPVAGHSSVDAISDLAKPPWSRSLKHKPRIMRPNPQPLRPKKKKNGHRHESTMETYGEFRSIR